MVGSEPIQDAEFIVDEALHDEIFPNVMKTSIEFDRDLVLMNLNALNEYVKQIPFIVEGYDQIKEEDPWDLLSCYICYNWEVFYTARRSMIYALNSYYNNAFTLLRGVYDMQVHGAFFQCLSQEKFREQGLPPAYKTSELLALFNEISEHLKKERNDRERAKKLSVYLFDILRQIRGATSKPEIYLMLKAFENWLKSKEFSNYLPSTSDLYFRLSRNVHQNFRLTDIGRQLLSGPEYPFERPPIPMKESTLEYLHTFHEVIDFCVAIQLGVFYLQLDQSHFEKKVRILREDKAFGSAQFRVAKLTLGEFFP
jgi:hypothetical protein